MWYTERGRKGWRSILICSNVLKNTTRTKTSAKYEAERRHSTILYWRSFKCQNRTTRHTVLISQVSSRHISWFDFVFLPPCYCVGGVFLSWFVFPQREGSLQINEKSLPGWHPDTESFDGNENDVNNIQQPSQSPDLYNYIIEALNGLRSSRDFNQY